MIYLLFEKDGQSFMARVVDAHEGGGVLSISTPSDDDPSDGGVDITDIPGFTMTDLVQSMNAASQRGDCVAVLQSYRPKATP